MNRIVFVLSVIAGVTIAAPASAADVMAGDLKISMPWARATPKGAKVGGGYVSITNTGTSADRLIGGASPVSDKLEIHEMSMSNGIMKMRPVKEGLEIKPGEKVELKPGGYHLMFMGLNKPFAKGEAVEATLTFEKAGKVDVKFPVAPIGAKSPSGMQHGH